MTLFIYKKFLNHFGQNFAQQKKLSAVRLKFGIHLAMTAAGWLAIYLASAEY